MDKWVIKELEARGVTNLGSYVKLIRDNEETPEKLKALGVSTGEMGGFGVPENWADNIMSGAPPTMSIIRPKALVLKCPPASPDGKFNLPGLRWGAGGAYGNVTFVTADEGVAGQSDDPKFDGIMLEPQRTSCYFTIGNSLLRNVPAMNTVIENIFRNAKAGWEEFQFLQGSGLTVPHGILNAPCAVRVPRNTAATVKFADILAMFARSYGSPIWIASMSVLPQLVGLVDGNGNAAFDSGPQGNTLLSLPVAFTRRQPTSGNVGDLLLVDPSFYAIADGSMFILASGHPFFTSDLTLVKLTFYIDGESWLRAPLTLEDGTTASPVVVLQ